MAPSADAESLRLLTDSLRTTMSAASGAKLDAALTDVGWRDMLDEMPDIAIPLVFTLLGETGAHAPLLNDVLLCAAGEAPGGTLALPFTGGSWVLWERRDSCDSAIDELLPIHRVPQGDPLPAAALHAGGGRWAGGWSAPAGPCSRWAAGTPSTACSSVGTSARSRRSGIGWPRPW
ncbi:putative acyl-CoA dehydrogenase [Mycobacterium avium subsp. avium 2285 (R)]|nr:putative acyl-CoA dehydrogenase [Mycobacterium avium subsp. avium 2285 (R)]